MTFADMTIQGIDLEFACTKLDNVLEDIESLKAMIAELLDGDYRFPGDDVLTPGSRFRKLLSIKALIYSMGIDAFSARRSVNAALAYQQSSLPNPEGIE
jgi:hypothetical protein